MGSAEGGDERHRQVRRDVAPTCLMMRSEKVLGHSE
jgi:hypothetical protein